MISQSNLEDLEEASLRGQSGSQEKDLFGTQMGLKREVL